MILSVEGAVDEPRRPAAPLLEPLPALPPARRRRRRLTGRRCHGRAASGRPHPPAQRLRQPGNIIVVEPPKTKRLMPVVCFVFLLRTDSWNSFRCGCTTCRRRRAVRARRAATSGRARRRCASSTRTSSSAICSATRQSPTSNSGRADPSRSTRSLSSRPVSLPFRRLIFLPHAMGVRFG